MLVCDVCSRDYPDQAVKWQCDCGGTFRYEFIKPPVLDPADIVNRPMSMWRYASGLPEVKPEDIVSLGEPITPLIDLEWDNNRVLAKLDYLMPTGSFKDRGTALMISRFRAMGIRHIIEDSSGNAGSSIAAYAGKARIRADIYVPAYTSQGKKVQIQVYGANLTEVEGTREDTTRKALEAASHTFYGSHNWSPYFIEGIKTQAYEIWEQLGWQVPDVVVAPGGYGSSLLGQYLGWKSLLQCGRICRMPRIVLVQSAYCDPVVRAWKSGLDNVPGVTKQETVAEGISCSKPLRGTQMLEAIRTTGGCAVSVEDRETWRACTELAKRGVFVEPTAGAAPAGARKLQLERWIKPHETVVIPLTGSGLKATDKVLELVKKWRD